MKHCRHCGEQIDSDAVICVKCGKQVEELKTSKPSKPVFSIIILWVIGLISFFSLIGAGSNMNDLRSVSGTSIAERYYQLMGSAIIGSAFIILLLTVYCSARLIQNSK